MLKHILQPHKNYNIYIDIKDTIGCQKICKLKDILQYKTRNDDVIVKNIQVIRSYEAELLQLADILIGAVSYKDRWSEIKEPNQVKVSICEKLEKELFVNFDKNSRYADEKFNLLVWEGK